MISHSFNKDKAIHSLIFIANNISDKNGVADIYRTLKILYFAELKHVKKYGRLITDDLIARLEHGSTPSRSYDLLKAKNKEVSFLILNNKEFKPNVALDIDELSESDIECLTDSINENKNIEFPRLKDKAHDQAYKRTQKDGKQYVPIEYILEQLKLSTEQIGFIKERYEFLNLIEWLPF